MAVAFACDRSSLTFTMRGFAAGHERRQDEHIHNTLAVAPVITCSRFTNAVSLHRGHTGVRRTERLEDARDLLAVSILVLRNEIHYTRGRRAAVAQFDAQTTV